MKFRLKADAVFEARDLKEAVRMAAEHFERTAATMEDWEHRASALQMESGGFTDVSFESA
jgi:hypothetical protein